MDEKIMDDLDKIYYDEYFFYIPSRLVMKACEKIFNKSKVDDTADQNAISTKMSADK